MDYEREITREINKDIKTGNVFGINFKKIIGFLITYVIVLFYIPYYLYFNASDTVFITYFANVDIVANILSVNFPEYFKAFYDIEPSTVLHYISFNVIGIVALTGIFTHGISLKNKKRYSDISILITLIIMSVVTWTLPTQLIPYMVSQVKTKYKITDASRDVLITTLISLSFISIEGLLIWLIVDKKMLFSGNNWLHKVKFRF